MLGLIPPKVHRVLDFVMVAIFGLAPFLLVELEGNTLMLSYGLAAVHLVMTLLTRFPGDSPRPIPFRIHGFIELAVGVALVALPLIRSWTHDARPYYLATGAAILIVWVLSRYEDAPAPAGRVTA